jgi:hypothetical protein
MFYYNMIVIRKKGADIMESRTARLTILIDPRKKKLFEEICARQDLNSSQVVRRLMRQYMLENIPADEVPDWLVPHVAKSE